MSDTSSKLALRPVADDDLPIFFEHQRDPEAQRMAAFPAKQRDAFMVHWRTKLLADPSNEIVSIVVDGEVAGYISSWDHDDIRLIGYWLGREHWGRGLATAALTEYLANHEQRRPVHAYVVTHNLGSIRVLEKCGFDRVGGPSVAADGVEELLFRLDRVDMLDMFDMGAHADT